jgi:hypothetical protein
MRRKERVSFVDFHEDEDEYEEKPRYCQHCLEYELQNKLRPVRVPFGKEPKPDHDLFLECWHCGTIYPKYETKSEQALEPFKETTDNPFEDTKVIESAFPKRNSPKGKKQLDKRKREKYRTHHPDKEIDALLRIYGEDNVKVVYDSMPEGDTR